MNINLKYKQPKNERSYWAVTDRNGVSAVFFDDKSNKEQARELAEQWIKKAYENPVIDD